MNEPSIPERQTISPHALDPMGGAAVAELYPPDLRPLVAGVAGTSPYLAQVLRQEARWIAESAYAPEAALARAMEETRAVANADGDGRARAPSVLRKCKRRVAGLLALGDLGGAFSLEQVTVPLTDFADAAVAGAFGAALGDAREAGALPASVGMGILAMGKMGAHELNYSSDIDLILLFEEARHDEPGEVRHTLVRAARLALKTLSEITPEGYVFRTDVRLRPDASITPLVVGVETARRYYEQQGRTWERLAHIKARPCQALEPQVCEAAIASLVPFVWRRRLDFAAIRDIYEMRVKIRNHNRLHDPGLDGCNLKLGRGGIRDIELFVQSHQVVHGGRNRQLRLRGTLEALGVLLAGGWLANDIAHTLEQIYRRHRMLEHRLQMVRDAQTHSLPNTPEEWARIAALHGTQVDLLRASLREDMEAVSNICEPFLTQFQPSPPAKSTGAQEPLEHPVAVRASEAEMIERWRGYAALRSPRAIESFDRLCPFLLRHLASAINPDQALSHFDHFLQGLPSGVQLFSLFEARPALADLLVSICVKSPVLAEYLGHNSGLLDVVLDEAFFAPLGSKETLEATLGDVLAAQSDYEDVLTEVRTWTKEQHFRIGAQLLQGYISAAQAGEQYARLAGAVMVALMPHEVRDFARTHGDAPGKGAVVVAMGSFGAERLHASSDLDLILVYDVEGVEMSDGPRPLDARSYYGRLTKALITALTALLPSGRLYEVDMRLRPSGRSGPLATSFQAFEDYQHNEAWSWEHLALTRARVVAEASARPSDLAARVEAVRAREISRKRDAAKLAVDLDDMRARLLEARPGTDELDQKNGPGGSQDVELLAQALGLLSGSCARDVNGQVQDGVRAGLLSPHKGAQLSELYERYWIQRAIGMLVNPDARTAQELGDAGLVALVDALGIERDKPLTERQAALQAQIASDRQFAGAVIEECLLAMGEDRERRKRGKPR